MAGRCKITLSKYIGELGVTRLRRRVLRVGPWNLIRIMPA